jgi:smad nuclear-interacting protein 1
MVKGVVLKFTEPLEAAVPKDGQWAIYPFKGDQALSKCFFEFNFIEPINLGSKQSCYLFGRDTRVADIILENPSCSM